MSKNCAPYDAERKGDFSTAAKRLCAKTVMPGHEKCRPEAAFQFGDLNLVNG